MREIKFRAWDNVYKKMFWPTQFMFNEHESVVMGGAHTGGAWCQDFELMQYTGLKDTNGVEIYEGDILEYTSNFRGYEDKVKLHVMWSDTNGMWMLGCIRTDYAIKKSIVIGNIYENPELLEVER